MHGVWRCVILVVTMPYAAQEGFSAFTQKRKPDFRKLARKD